MELETLHSSWSKLDARVEELEAANRGLTAMLALDRSRDVARRLRREPISELVVSLAVLLVCGNWFGSNVPNVLREPLGALPGLFVTGISLWTLIVSLLQLDLISKLDLALPIVEAQRVVLRLESIRLRTTQIMLLLGIVFWLVFPFFGFQMLVGYELHRAIHWPWAFGNFAVGGLLVVGLIFCGRRFSKSAFWRGVDRVLAGDAVVLARQSLAEVEAFARS